MTLLVIVDTQEPATGNWYFGLVTECRVTAGQDRQLYGAAAETKAMCEGHLGIITFQSFNLKDVLVGDTVTTH